MNSISKNSEAIDKFGKVVATPVFFQSLSSLLRGSNKDGGKKAAIQCVVDHAEETLSIIPKQG